MRYNSAAIDVLAQVRLMPLGPGMPNHEVRAALSDLTPARAFAPYPVKDEPAALACLAGLWLLHDHLDESHRICQDLHTAEGSYWHAILHRREPDYSNSKYWFRRVGRHPIFAPLAQETAELARKTGATALVTASGWDPFAFVDLCERAGAADGDLEMSCRLIQQREWELLFDFCCRRALGD